MIKCSSCGGVNPNTASNCEYCFATLSHTSTQIDGTEVKNGQSVTSPESGTVQVENSDLVPSPVATTNDSSVSMAQDDLPPYYVKAFSDFDTLAKSNPGRLQAKFNWAAFLFGPFWYLYRGLWAKALIYFGVALGTVGIFVLVPWIYASAFGTYDLYLLRRHNKQLW